MKEMKRLVHHHGDQIDPQTALGVIDQGFPDYCRMVGMIGPTRRFFEIGLGQLKSQGIQSIEADIQPGGGFPPFSYQPQSEVGFLFPRRWGVRFRLSPFHFSTSPARTSSSHTTRSPIRICFTYSPLRRFRG